ncbi:MAG TPA: GrpB family protein [Streptosporangiaceae bacterium]|nr:GrpB family protein [Streptosporangiaceae bacterium]
MRPVVVAYQAGWPQRAAALAASLRQLGPLAERIEHIGSTSIPGMAAKDILDMQISVPSLDQATSAFEIPLAGLGFERLPYNHDHVPAGLDDSRDRWAKRYWRRRGRLGDVNLHVRRTGSPNERLALLFRDWFRAHPAAVAGYAAFKRALAAQTPDVDVYTDVKDPVVDVIIAAAEDWAVTANWRP